MNSDETDSLVYFYLAETCFSLEKYDNAIEYADQFSKCSDYAELIQTHPHVFRIYTFKIFSMLFLKNYYTQEDIYEVITESLEMVPFHPELKRNEADFYLSMGKLDEALTSFICAIELQEKYKHFHTNNFQRTMDDVLYKTGEIYYLKGDSDLALKYYYESLNAYKYNAKSFNRVLAEIKEKNPAEIISILNGIYDLKEFEDIEFISIHLAKNKMTIPFFYYFIKNWKWKYDDYGSLMSIALLLKGDSIKALRTSLSCYIKDKNAENERYIVISLVCGNHLDWYNKNKQVLSHKYQNILDVYFNVKDIQFFTEEEIKCCQNLLRELFTFENKQFFNNFMGKTPILVRESFEVIGDILKDNKCYEPAIDFYKKAILKQENNSIKTKLNFKLGFCYYHIKAYKESIDAFEKGLHSSDKINQNEFIQYLKWICEKEYDMKKRIEALIAKVEQR
jgi:tetratricopeptide (TPR) repeat protein